jgi:peptidoglycan/xylan/chitin deacetylase (PgdA/CDA1 family)
MPPALNGRGLLVLCVDLDEWYHCRWATGASSSRWASVDDCFSDCYESNRPAGEIVEPTRWILNCLKETNTKVTFNILGEVAQWYPELVRQIAQEGHEIACHGMHHRDLTLTSRRQFSQELAQARQLLEELSGRRVVGFRAPNLVVTDWLPGLLIEQGFTWDSSVCPAGNFGKFKGHSHAPTQPYWVSPNSLFRRGGGSLVEIPVSVFPILKLPGGTSISTRILGWAWSRITLDASLKSGFASYYMHPYEFNAHQGLKGMHMRERIFLRRTGDYMKLVLRKILGRYQGRVVTAGHYASHCLPRRQRL